MQGRENARQTRQSISAEMWTSLNLSYLRIQDLSIEDIWEAAPESFYSETVSAMNTFGGMASATMYRDEGWRFMQVGRAIEQAQLTAALLLAQIAVDDEVEDHTELDWGSLLRVYHAFEAYRRRYSIEVVPGHVLELLTADAMLPRSLSRSLDAASAQLAEIGPGPNSGAYDDVSQLADRLTRIVREEAPAPEEREDQLQQIYSDCLKLHELVIDSYFEYEVE